MKKKLIIPISLISIVALIAVFYVSYGFVSARITNNELSKKQTFMNQKLEIEYSDGTETLTSNNTSFIPGSTITKTFTIKNNGNVKLNFKINLENVTNTFSRKEDITYELYLNERLLISNIYPSTNITIAYNQTLNVSETKKYTLKIIYNNSEENQIIDQGKGITGKLTFGDQKNNLTNLKILGNSIQTGTPSTATPSTIESVGDKTENLINYKEYIKYDGIRKIKNGLQLENITGTHSFTISYTFKANTTYILSADVEGELYFGGKLIQNGDSLLEGYRWITSSNASITTGTTTSHVIINNSSNQDITRDICLRIVNWQTGMTATIKNIKLEISPSKTEYEPYGYKIPITVRSINLYKPTRISAEALRTPNAIASLQNSVGTTLNTNDATSSEIIVTQSSIGNNNLDVDYSNGYFCIETGEKKFEHNKKYKLSFDCEILNNLLNTNNMLIGPNFVIRYEYITAKNGRVSQEFTYIINDVGNDNFIEIRNMGKSLKIKNIMITDLGDPTEYTPYIEPFTQYIYLDEPLRKIGEYEDYIDLKEGKVYRYVEVIDDTGTLPLNESLRGLDSPIIEDVELPSIFSINPDLKIVADTTVSASLEKE